MVNDAGSTCDFMPLLRVYFLSKSNMTSLMSAPVVKQAVLSTRQVSALGTFILEPHLSSSVSIVFSDTSRHPEVLPKYLRGDRARHPSPHHSLRCPRFLVPPRCTSIPSHTSLLLYSCLVILIYDPST
jgi:hypothetical protein